ncbi:MAG: cupin domain-containing protein [Candidatus Krumholzibacteriia bacterium]
MKGFVKDIENLAVRNESYRKVLYTANDTQLVLMTLDPGQDIGLGTDDLDQFFRVEEGTGEVTLDGVTTAVHPGFGVLIPAGVHHNLVNTGSHPLKLYTLLSPPNLRDGAVFATREAAEADDHGFDGETTE